ncbi:MAG: hypothetical protein ACFFDF_17195 [Candidatus Odinarchaeota archaeon]
MNLHKLKQSKIYLLAFTNSFLKDLCKLYKIKRFSNLNKEEIIDLILKSIPKTKFDSFLQDIEKRSLISTLSLVPKYFLKENPTKLENLNFDIKNKLLKLKFKGFRWEIFTEIYFQNLNNKEEPLKFNFNCNCEYARDGGFCSHFWVGLIWAFEKFSIQTSRWNMTKLPEIFNELKAKLDFTAFYKDAPTLEKLEILSIEDFLKRNFMGKTQFDYEDLEDLSIKDILTFISQSNIRISEKEQIKPKKNKLIELIKNQLNNQKFNKIFFEFKKNSRISEAKKILIDIDNLVWGPPLSCHAKLRVMKEKQEESIDLVIEKNQIKHSNCHWVYHRQNFCSHLIALFLNLSSKNLSKTFEYLKNYLKE